MMNVLRRTATVAAALVACSTLARAQAKCEVDDGKPAAVKNARNNLVKAGLLGKPEERHKQVTDAIKMLTTNPDQTNPAGRGLVLGRALVMLGTEPNASMVTTRAAAGYATDPQANIDLLLAADSAFDLVDGTNAACKTETAQYRQALYVPTINAAVKAYNEKQVDSAVALANRSLIIYAESPIAYNILGNAAQVKDDIPGAIDAFKKMVVAMGTDTAYKDDKKTVMMSIAQLTSMQAQKVEGAARGEAVKKAIAEYEAYLKEYPNDTDAASAVAGLKAQSGDSTAAKALFTEMTSNAAKYSAMQLFEAGVNAARAEDAQAAIKLFEAGLQKNAYYRDALFNLGATYHSSGDIEKMPPILQRLLEVDPNNPDNMQLVALYYQTKLKNEKAAAAKKTLTDSLVKYATLFQDAPLKVSFNLFSHGEGNKHTLGGNVENRGDAQKGPYEMKFEFLDGTGKVVASKSATVEQIPGKGSKPFRVEVQGEGIVAFRYAKLDS
jgi:tetratricopeptide (TPR) repeat protein